MTVESLLQSCDKVRDTGHGKWIACCPAHEDRSPSLAIKECSDGKVLLKCFAGCETEDVLAAVGMTFSDIMPEKVGTEHSYRPQKWINAKDALATLDHESLVVAIIGADFIKRKSLDDETWDRLATAVNRINSARAEAAPLKFKKWHGPQQTASKEAA